MPGILIGILLFLLFLPAAQAVQHASSFGYGIYIPGNWLVFSKNKLKDNPDLFGTKNPRIEKAQSGAAGANFRQNQEWK